MKRRLLILTGLGLWAIPTWAALHFGLGSAVAKRSADLINQAGVITSNPSGDNVAPTLPACPDGAIYDTLPTDLSQIAAIDPLGHVAPPPHTFPSDHIYFYRTIPVVSTVPIYAPGTIHVTRVTSSEVLSANPVFTDYAIYFYACKDVKSYFAHVRTLSASLQSQVGAIDQNCMTYTTGGTFHSCEKDTNILAASGEILGYSAVSGAFDFGSYDYRIPPLPFIMPARHTADQLYAVCPVDYFTDGPKAAMQALLGRFDGGHPRVTPPICGKTMFDIAGTAKGDWYHPGSPDIPEDPHLSLIDNNASAPQQTISLGNSLLNQLPGIWTFNPASGGLINRDFSQVTEGAVYCYDSYFDPVGQPFAAPPIFLIQLVNATTLRIESQPVANCSAGSWTFGANAVDFQR